MLLDVLECIERCENPNIFGNRAYYPLLIKGGCTMESPTWVQETLSSWTVSWPPWEMEYIVYYLDPVLLIRHFRNTMTAYIMFY